MYLTWEQQGSLLFTWLLTMLSDSVLLRIVRWFNHIKFGGKLIHKHTFEETNTRSRQFRFELKLIFKGEKTIAEYLAHIQKTADVLDLIDGPISHGDQLEAILDGLADDYSALISIFLYHVVTHSIIEVESMHLSHESKVENMKQVVLAEPLSANVAQVTHSVPNSTYQPTYDAVSAPNFDPMSQVNGNCGRGVSI